MARDSVGNNEFTSYTSSIMNKSYAMKLKKRGWLEVRMPAHSPEPPTSPIVDLVRGILKHKDIFYNPEETDNIFKVQFAFDTLKA